jgi:hypothetical protein
MKQSTRYLSLVLLVALSVLLPAVSNARSTQPEPPGPASSQQSPEIQDLPLVKDTVSNTIQKNEVPRIAISRSNLNVVWKSGNSLTHSRTGFNARPEVGSDWPPQQMLGVSGIGTYNTASVAVSPVDDSVHVVWADTSRGGDGYMFYSRRLPDGSWTTPLKISSVGRFAHYPHATVDTTGRIWAVWSAEDPPGNDNIYYRYSADNGLTWQPGKEGKIDGENAKRPWIAADKSGGVHVTWWRYEGGVWYARWTGSSWTKEGIPSGGFNADPSITVDASNQIHLAWRRQRGFAAWDVYYATKPVGASSHDWQISQLYRGGNIDKTVVIYADEQSTLHLAWYDTVKGNEVWYSRKPAGGDWLSPPIDVSNDGLFNTNPDVVGRTDANGVRAHVVFESWFGGDRDVRIQHVQVGTVVPPAAAQPVIRGQALSNGLKGTRNPNLTVDFANVTGSPDQIRYHFGSPPTANDSWQPFATTMTIASNASADACAPLYLYTQVRSSATNQVQQTASSDLIVVDQGIQALVPIRSEASSLIGDADYIKTPAYLYNVVPEPYPCAGIASYQALDVAPADPVHAGSDTSDHAVTLSTQGWQTEGGGFAERNVATRVTLTDALGNTAIIAKTLHYDDDPPQVASGTATATNSGGASAISTLNLANISVTDDSYGAAPNVPATKAYWGVWVLVSETNLGTPTEADFINHGVVVQVPHGAASADVSLIGDGMPAQGKTMKDAGARFIYIRFFDGAGNASSQIKSAQVTLNQGYSVPRIYLPYIP